MWAGKPSSGMCQDGSAWISTNLDQHPWFLMAFISKWLYWSWFSKLKGQSRYVWKLKPSVLNCVNESWHETLKCRLKFNTWIFEHSKQMAGQLCSFLYIPKSAIKYLRCPFHIHSSTAFPAVVSDKEKEKFSPYYYEDSNEKRQL